MARMICAMSNASTRPSSPTGPAVSAALAPFPSIALACLPLVLPDPPPPSQPCGGAPDSPTRPGRTADHIGLRGHVVHAPGLASDPPPAADVEMPRQPRLSRDLHVIAEHCRAGYARL